MGSSGKLVEMVGALRAADTAEGLGVLDPSS